MTEAELYAAFQGAVSSNSQILFGYISLMTAFLVMSYLVAHKLPPVLASIVVALFSLVSILLIFQSFFNRVDAEQIMAYMLEQKQMGNFDLPWLGTNPAWGAQVATVLNIGVFVGGFLACIDFFEYRRRTTHRAK